MPADAAPLRAWPGARRDRVLLLLLYLALATILSHAHAVKVDQRHKSQILQHHADTIASRERDPYQYKFFTVAWAVEGAHRATGLGVFFLYMINQWLALLALLLAHHLWLGRLYGPGAALSGTLLLAALAHTYFLGYHHHPYDAWGLAGFCLLLSAAGGNASLGRLCVLALATGLVWEKHAFLPLLWGVRLWRGGEPLRRVVPRVVAFAACAVLVPVAIRLVCGTDREAVDVTTLSQQDWGAAAAHHLPLLVLFGAILAWRWDDVPAWVRLNWLHVPVLFTGYLAARYMIDEPRSFWAFAPVFTATACAWWPRLAAPASPAPRLAA